MSLFGDPGVAWPRSPHCGPAISKLVNGNVWKLSVVRFSAKLPRYPAMLINPSSNSLVSIFCIFIAARARSKLGNFGVRLQDANKKSEGKREASSMTSFDVEGGG